MKNYQVGVVFLIAMFFLTNFVYKIICFAEYEGFMHFLKSNFTMLLLTAIAVKVLWSVMKTNKNVVAQPDLDAACKRDLDNCKTITRTNSFTRKNKFDESHVTAD